VRRGSYGRAADRQLAPAAAAIVIMYNMGINDYITNKPITLDEYRWALKTELAFSFLGGLKTIGNLFGK